MPLAFWLSRGKCREVYQTPLPGQRYPKVRCTRRARHDGPHRAPFGLEWE